MARVALDVPAAGSRGMSNERRRHAWRIPAALALWCGLGAAACGGEPPDGDGVTATQSELLSGNGNVRQVTGQVSSQAIREQSETAMVINPAAGIITIGYNGDDPTHVTYTTTDRVVSRGFSGMEYSSHSTTATTWGGSTRLAPPSSMAVIWSDPVLGQITGTQNVFYAMLAIPSALWPASGTVSGNLANFIKGTCIARSSDGGRSFAALTNADCINTGTDVIDGGSMGSNTSTLTVAYWNVTRARIDAWQSTSAPGWTKLPDPFPGKNIQSHPKMAGGVLMAADGAGQIWVTTLAGAGWDPPMLAASDFNNQNHVVAGQTIRTEGFTLEYGNLSSPFSSVAAVWYATAGGGVKGVKCTITPSINRGCFAPTGWHTPAGWNAFMPSIAGAHVNDGTMFGHNAWLLTVWRADTANTVQMASTRVDASDTALTWAVAIPGNQIPCASVTNHYWGDYDDTRVEVPATGAPKFHRGFTESDQAACSRTQQWNALPQHVSELIVPAT
jgi:hypothetical protein